jgi:hypothetical protein
MKSPRNQAIAASMKLSVAVDSIRESIEALKQNPDQVKYIVSDIGLLNDLCSKHYFEKIAGFGK